MEIDEIPTTKLPDGRVFIADHDLANLHDGGRAFLDRFKSVLERDEQRMGVIFEEPNG